MKAAVIAAACWFALGGSLPALASPATVATGDFEQARESTEKLVKLLVDQGLLSRERAQALLVDLEGPPPASSKPAAKPPVVAVVPVPAPAVVSTPSAPLTAPLTAPPTAAVTSPVAPTPSAATSTASPAAADASTAAAAAPAGAASAARPGTVRVPYLPAFVRQEIKNELRAELKAEAIAEGLVAPDTVPAWTRSLNWSGDLRTRLQADDYDENNAAAISVIDTNRNRAITLANSTVDRQRLRVRARLGLAYKADDHWDGSLRITTGSTTDPLTSNQTLGNYGNRYVIALDRAFLRWQPAERFEITAGRYGNPWFGSELLWANDLSFDGVAAQWKPRLSNSVNGFLTVAAMPVQEVELSSSDKWLYGVQGGVQWPGRGLISGKLGLGYYHYRNITGRLNQPGSSLADPTAPAFAQRGNTYFNISSDAARPLFALASEYRLVNLTAQVDALTIANKHLVLSGDYVKNIGFDRDAVSARLGQDVSSQTTGYLVQASLGDASFVSVGQWQVFFSYRRVERDAVLDAFTDSDLRGGGTDAKGYTLGGSMALGKQTALTARWLSGDSIDGPPLKLDSLQVDLQVRF